MRVIVFLISLQFIFIKSGIGFDPTEPNITKLVITCSLAGVTTYDIYKSKINFCNIHKEIKQKLLYNIDNEKEDYQKQEIDWNKRIIYYHYAKRLYLPDRWHQLFFIYSYSAHVAKNKAIQKCREVRSHRICHKEFIPDSINNKDIEAMKNKAFNTVISKANVQFSSSVDESMKKLFYAYFPFLRK